MHHSPVQQLGTCHADTAMKYYNNLPPMGMALSSHIVASCEWMLQANVDECNYMNYGWKDVTHILKIKLILFITNKHQPVIQNLCHVND